MVNPQRERLRKWIQWLARVYLPVKQIIFTADAGICSSLGERLSNEKLVSDLTMW
jgi:hypothetical protein